MVSGGSRDKCRMSWAIVITSQSATGAGGTDLFLSAAFVSESVRRPMVVGTEHAAAGPLLDDDGRTAWGRGGRRLPGRLPRPRWKWTRLCVDTHFASHGKQPDRPGRVLAG